MLKISKRFRKLSTIEKAMKKTNTKYIRFKGNTYTLNEFRDRLDSERWLSVDSSVYKLSRDYDGTLSIEYDLHYKTKEPYALYCNVEIWRA